MVLRKSFDDWVREHPEFRVELWKWYGYAVDPDGWEHTLVDLRVSYRDDSIVIPYRTGLAITEDAEDRPAEILDIMISDTWGIMTCHGFEGWAREYGLDIDDPKQREREEAGYYRVEEFAGQVRRLLGDEVIEDLALNYKRP